MIRRPRKPSSGRRPSRSQACSRVFEATIEKIGAQGDGIARLDDETVFIPLTVPGDRVTGRIEGKRGDGLVGGLAAIVAPGAGRVSPPCPHFGRCGGCALQHWRGEDCAAWKRSLVQDALHRAGLPAEAVLPLVSTEPGTRRRATFAFRRQAGAVALGFNERSSHRLVTIEDCLLLTPPLVALLLPLRRLLGDLGGATEGEVAVTSTETGLDVLIGGRFRLDLFDRERMAAFAEDEDLARIALQGPGGFEPVAIRRPPMIRFAGVPVLLPPAAFLQPSCEGERALAGLVFDAVGNARHVADLFAGLGSFTFPLAQKAGILAVEGDAEQAGALDEAARGARARVEVRTRDLFRSPLEGGELKGFDAVVFDPPRAGAAAQAEALAAKGPDIVVAVSCNPATLSRDGRILAGGGYRLEKAVPVDQFPWSAHVEVVASFRR